MVLIFASLVQFAFIFERQIGIENAVRDAARRAATYATITDAQANVNGPSVWHLLTDAGGLLQSNVQSYDGTYLEDAEVCYRDQNDPAGLSAVLVKVIVTYRHPLFLPLITQIIDGIDGHVDNALWVSTSSEFTVQNDAGTAWSVTPHCYTPA